MHSDCINQRQTGIRISKFFNKFLQAWTPEAGVGDKGRRQLKHFLPCIFNGGYPHNGNIARTKTTAGGDIIFDKIIVWKLCVAIQYGIFYHIQSPVLFAIGGKIIAATTYTHS